MEALLVLLGLLAAAYALLAPAMALAFAISANRRARSLETRMLGLERDLAWEKYNANSARLAAAAAQRAVAEARAVAGAGSAPVATTSLEPSPLAETPPLAAAVPFAAAGSPAPQPAFQPPFSAAGSPAPQPAFQPPFGAPGSPAPQPAFQPPFGAPAFAASSPAGAGDSAPGQPPPQSPDQPTLEERLGLTWLTRVGAAAFVLGALFFFKYAVDSAWIGPAGRVAVGVLVGVILLVLSEITAAKSRPGFVQSLAGIGLAVLFVSVWASAALYDLVPSLAALAANTAILFVGAGLAVRRRGEAVLVIALVAGFLNPVILSTGQDRPLELFAYLLLITTVALGVATELDFRFVPWICVAGTTLLFGGWYDRFFDASDRRGNAYADLPVEQLVGAYHELGARVVPLAAAALFAVQWVASALRTQAKAASPLRARSLAVSGLVLAHGAAALLLFDTPRLFAITATLLAVGSIAALRSLSASSLLMVPMGAAFVAFVAVSSDVPDADRSALVTLLGVWTAAYVAGFLVGPSGELRRPELPVVTPGAAVRAASGIGLFSLLAAILLVEHHPTMFALILAGASLAVAALASRSGLSLLLLVSSILSLVAMLGASTVILDRAPPAGFDGGFLGAVALWALAYLAGIAYDALARRAPVTWGTTITASMATLGFLGVALLSTSEDVPTLRALLTAGAGVADLALGAALLRAQPERRDPPTILLGEALGMFAAALAFGLAGAPVTVLWAALATVAAAIAARTREPLWIGIASLLFGAALVRLLAVDVAGTAELVDRFHASSGRDGAIRVPVLFNARAYGLAGTGAALLLSAWLTARGHRRAAAEGAPRASSDPLQAFAALAGIAGYGLVLGLAVSEVRSALTTYPPLPPAPLDYMEWSAFESQIEATLAAQRGSLGMMTTLVLGAAAAALLSAGFVARDAFHRYLGLSLFLLTVAKLALWDVWNIERIYQIVLLTGVGALLVAGGFLYARFGKRLVALMKEGSPEARAGGRHVAGPLVALLLLASARGASAQPTPLAAPVLSAATYTTERSIEGVSAPGDYRFEVDVDLYRGSTSAELLADLRIAGPSGVEVPYVLREMRPLRPSEAVDATLLDPGIAADGAARATFALTTKGRRHCRVALEIDGDGFLRTTRVETAATPAAFATVAEGGYVYRIPASAGAAERLVVDYPLSEAPYLRVTLLEGPASGNDPAAASAFRDAVRITGGKVTCPSPETEVPSMSVPLQLSETKRGEDGKSTLLLLDAGAEGVPVDAVSLAVQTGEFSRRVTVAATTYRQVWPEVGAGMIYRVQPRGGFAAASTRIPTTETRKRWFQITIQDDDSAPLSVSAVEGEVKKREVVFRAPAAGAYSLYTGDKQASAPSYDLAAILARADRDEAPHAVTLGASGPNAMFGKAVVQPALPWTEQYRLPLGIGLGVVLVGLSLWTLLLMRKGGGSAGSQAG